MGNKVTDEEIMKALECCVSDECTCNECPYEYSKHIVKDEFEIMPNGKTYDTWSCDEWLKRDLFDLINRLQAENTKLEYILLGVMHCVDKWLEGDELNQDEVNRAITMREKVLQIIEGKQLEVEKLMNECGNQGILWKQHFESIFESAKEVIKIEATKEFADRLVSIYTNDETYDRPNPHTSLIKLFHNIDSIKKEMLGEI